MAAPVTQPISLQDYARSEAIAHGVDPDLFLRVIGCESRWDPSAIGDGGTSFGIAQFHNPETDWGFTREQALNPYFALDAAAKAMSTGKGSHWTCYRKFVVD